MNRFSNQVIVVTGASSGIGRATSLQLANEGCRVILIARKLPQLEETRAQLAGTGHLVCPCDVTDEIQVVELFNNLREQVGSVNGLVHCAGIHWLRPLKVTDSAALLEMLHSHIVSSVALTRALVARRVASKDGCSVVWLSSAAALRGEVGTVAYAAAKGGLISGARAIAVELAPRRIRVNVLAPGVVRTPQSEAFLGSLMPAQVQTITDAHLLGLGEPEDVSAAIAFLLSREARWITGITLVVDGGLTIH